MSELSANDIISTVLLEFTGDIKPTFTQRSERIIQELRRQGYEIVESRKIVMRRAVIE